jgi:hypothetical protein
MDLITYKFVEVIYARLLASETYYQYPKLKPLGVSRRTPQAITHTIRLASETYMLSSYFCNMHIVNIIALKIFSV